MNNICVGLYIAFVLHKARRSLEEQSDSVTMHRDVYSVGELCEHGVTSDVPASDCFGSCLGYSKRTLHKQ